MYIELLEHYNLSTIPYIPEFKKKIMTVTTYLQHLNYHGMCIKLSYGHHAYHICM